MGEFVVLAALAVAGIGLLGPLHGRIPVIAAAALALPAGAAAYLVVGLGQLVVSGTVHPQAAFGFALVIGLGGLGIGVARRRVGVDTLVAAGLVVLGTAAVTLVALTQHLTRLTPDSMDHLMIAVDLRGPEAMVQVRPDDIMKRQVGLATLHTLSSVTGRDHVASLSPMFGAAAFAFFAWLVWARAAALPGLARWALPGLSVLFLAASNRMLFHAFYLNIHMIVALLVLVAVAALWMAVVDDEPSWAPIGGVALALALLFRPESALLVALVTVPLSASRAGWAVRAWVAGPLIGILVPWYSLLWRHVPGGSEVSLTAPVFGNAVLVVGSCLLLVLGGHHRTGSLARLADRSILWGLLGLLAVFAVSDPSILGGTLAVTWSNLGPDLTFAYSVGGSGLWLFTWVFAVAIAVLALLVHRVAEGRLWTTPIVGFGILYLLLPYLRGSPWREGSGDSGSRIVTHALMVLIAFAVIAAVGPHDDDGDVDAGDAAGSPPV